MGTSQGHQPLLRLSAIWIHLVRLIIPLKARNPRLGKLSAPQLERSTIGILIAGKQRGMHQRNLTQRRHSQTNQAYKKHSYRRKVDKGAWLHGASCYRDDEGSSTCALRETPSLHYELDIYMGYAYAAIPVVSAAPPAGVVACVRTISCRVGYLYSYTVPCGRQHSRVTLSSRSRLLYRDLTLVSTLRLMNLE